MPWLVDASWLPLPPDHPGSAAPGVRPARPVVADPAPVRPLLLVTPAGQDPVPELVRRAGDAWLAGAELMPGPGWAEAHLDAARARAGDPLFDAAVAWPGLVLAWSRRLLAGGARKAGLDLLRDSARLQRAAIGFTNMRRALYRGPAADLALLRVTAELEQGEPERGILMARRWLEGMAKLPGPWRLAELEAGTAIWVALAKATDLQGTCPEISAEAARLVAALAEARSALGVGARADAPDPVAGFDGWLPRPGQGPGRRCPFLELPPSREAFPPDAL